MNSQAPQRKERTAPREVLDAAAECFMQNGYAETTLDDVARHMGATKGRIYHYFGSKSELLHAVRKHAMSLNFEAISIPYNSDLPPVQKFSAMAHAHALNMMKEQAYQQALFDRLRLHVTGGAKSKSDVFAQEFMADRRAFEDMFRAVIAEGQRRGDFDVGSISYALHGVITMINSTLSWYRPRTGDAPDTQAKIADQLVTMALRALGAQTSSTKGTRQ